MTTFTIGERQSLAGNDEGIPREQSYRAAPVLYPARPFKIGLVYQDYSVAKPGFGGTSYPRTGSKGLVFDVLDINKKFLTATYRDQRTRLVTGANRSVANWNYNGQRTYQTDAELDVGEPYPSTFEPYVNMHRIVAMEDGTNRHVLVWARRNTQPQTIHRHYFSTSAGGSASWTIPTFTPIYAQVLQVNANDSVTLGAAVQVGTMANSETDGDSFTFLKRVSGGRFILQYNSDTTGVNKGVASFSAFGMGIQAGTDIRPDENDWRVWTLGNGLYVKTIGDSYEVWAWNEASARGSGSLGIGSTGLWIPDPLHQKFWVQCDMTGGRGWATVRHSGNSLTATTPTVPVGAPMNAGGHLFAKPPPGKGRIWAWGTSSSAISNSGRLAAWTIPDADGDSITLEMDTGQASGIPWGGSLNQEQRAWYDVPLPDDTVGLLTSAFQSGDGAGNPESRWEFRMAASNDPVVVTPVVGGSGWKIAGI